MQVQTYCAEVFSDLLERLAVLLFKYQKRDRLPNMLQLVPGRTCILFSDQDWLGWLIPASKDISVLQK
jgi:hypothetical protein